MENRNSSISVTDLKDVFDVIDEEQVATFFQRCCIGISCKCKWFNGCRLRELSEAKVTAFELVQWGDHF